MISDFTERAGRDEPVYITDVRDAFQREGTRPFDIELTLYDGENRRFDLRVPPAKSDAEREFIRRYLTAMIFNMLSSLGGKRMTVYTDPADRELTTFADRLGEIFQLDLPGGERTGYGRCVNVNERVLRLLEIETKFCFRVKPFCEEEKACATGQESVTEQLQDSETGRQRVTGQVQIFATGQAPVTEQLQDSETGRHRVTEKLQINDGSETLAGKDGAGEHEGGLTFLKNLPERAGTGALLGIDVGGTDIKLAASVDGRLISLVEYDWNPAAFTSADAFLESFFMPVKQIFEETGSILFDAVGISFPDVVIRNRIVGGETAKTRGMRENPACEYEAEFEKISRLDEVLRPFLKPGAPVRFANDGNMAAFTSAVETVAGMTASAFANEADLPASAGALVGEAEANSSVFVKDFAAVNTDRASVSTSAKDPAAFRLCPRELNDGFFAHSLGTDLGTGWVMEDGRIPELPLEVYGFIIDLGSLRSGEYPSGDVRSTRNDNTGLPGSLQKYVSQSGIFRLAMKNTSGDAKNSRFDDCSHGNGIMEELLRANLLEWNGDTLQVPVYPSDKRKALLEYIMAEAARRSERCSTATCNGDDTACAAACSEYHTACTATCSEYDTACAVTCSRDEAGFVRARCGNDPACKAAGYEETDLYAEVFRQVGEALAAAWSETDYLLRPKAKSRTLYGRLVKNPVCFDLLRQGAERRLPAVRFMAADADLACTPLMQQLKADTRYTVAQFAQAVGAIYFGLTR